MSNWEQSLDEFFQARGETKRLSPGERIAQHSDEARAFVERTALPAIEQVAAALQTYGRDIMLNTALGGRIGVSLRVRNAGRDEFEYIVGAHASAERATPFEEIVLPKTSGHQAVGASSWRGGAQDQSVIGISQDDVIQHVLTAYRESVTS